MAPTRVVSPGFRARVASVVRAVPRGRVATYGDVAGALGSPRVARHVGWALAALPEVTDVPWHRVINAQGRISFKGDLRRAEEQRRRLEAEGHVFDPAGRLPLRERRARLAPPSVPMESDFDDDLVDHELLSVTVSELPQT
jgi:methylated-DNA-protein-cysteine methyltransferase-like protein